MCNTLIYVLKFGYLNSYQLENYEIISYTWHICEIKKKSMHWWFKVFWHTLYSIDVLSILIYNHNKRLNYDGGHLLEMLHELVAEIMFRPMNKDKQAMEKRNIN